MVTSLERPVVLQLSLMHPMDQTREDQAHVPAFVHDWRLHSASQINVVEGLVSFRLIRSSGYSSTHLTHPARHLARQNVLHLLVVGRVKVQVVFSRLEVHGVFRYDGRPLVGF